MYRPGSATYNFSGVGQFTQPLRVLFTLHKTLLISIGECDCNSEMIDISINKINLTNGFIYLKTLLSYDLNKNQTQLYLRVPTKNSQELHIQ